MEHGARGKEHARIRQLAETKSRESGGHGARSTRTWLFYDLYTLQVSFSPSSYGVAGIPKRLVNFDESKK